MSNRDKAAQIVITLGIDALERVLGGDSEAAVEIRNTIVQQFASRHLKAIANSEVVRQVGATIEAAVVEAVQEEVGKKAPGFGGKWTFKKEVKDALHEEVRLSISTKVREEVQTAVQAALDTVKPDIARRVEAAVDKEIAARVKAAVDEKLRAAQAALQS